MLTGPRLASRRTVAALAAGVVAAGAAVALDATQPSAPLPSPPAPPAAADLPDAPGTIPLAPAAMRPKAPASVLTAVPGSRDLVWADRGTGVVRRGTVSASGVGVGATRVIARLPARTGPDAGVRGLAVTRDGQVYASFVRRRDHRLLVVRIADPRPRTVWRGPRTGPRRVGGGLAVTQGGRLVLGIGDQGRPFRASDPRSITGRVISLAPHGRPSQTPLRRSRGWHDPTALAVGRGGQIWVADRSGAGDPERMGRADRPRAGAVRSDFRRAPIALAISGGGRTLLVCGLVSGRLDRTPLRGVVAGSEPQVLRARCRYGVAVAGSRVYVSGDDGRIRLAGSVEQLRAAPAVE